MQANTLFDSFNFGVLPFWALLVIAPRWVWTKRLVHSGFAPAVLGVVYVVTLLSVKAPPGAGGHSLDAAMRLFDTPSVAFLCWMHYLAFDLFVGAWIARDAARLRIPHYAVVPCLLATLFFGPCGMVLYGLVRIVARRAVSIDERAAIPQTS